MIDQGKLIEFVEGWLAGRPSRSLSVLARVSGVPYATLRRIMQREYGASLETTFALLNIVATPAEILDFFPKKTPVMKVYEKIMQGSHQASPELIMKMLGRDNFWILALAMTIGATRERVEKMLGILGAAEFDKLIEEGLLVSQGDVYRYNDDADPILLENKLIAGEAVKYIAEAAAVLDFDRSKKRFAVYSIDEATYAANKVDIEECYQRIDERSRKSNGSTVMAASFVMAKVFSDTAEKEVAQ